MSGRSKSYKESLYRRLRNNAEAVLYLQTALEDSQSAFLLALRNVLEAHNVASVARESKLNREHIYRMLADKGNPTLNSLEKLLHALGLKLAIGLHNVSPNLVRRKETGHASWCVSAATTKHRVVVYAMPHHGTRSGHLKLEPVRLCPEHTISASMESSYSSALESACTSTGANLFEMAY